MRFPACAAFVFLGCAHASPRPDAASPQVLIDADAAFARDVAARGLDAWVDAFASDGAMFVPNQPPIRGHAAIREAMANLGDPRRAKPELVIRWKPLGARLSDDGTLGWTWGNGLVVTANGEHQSKYVTIWRKQPGGAWKVELDQGTPGWADPASPP